MTNPEITERALDDIVMRLGQAAIKALHLTPPAEWRSTLDQLCERIDAALKSAVAEAGRDPIVRAQFAAAWPELIHDRKAREAREISRARE
jgi:hypothetical protein